MIGLASIGVWIRFAVAYVEGNGKGHVQSLILGAVLFIAAVVLWALGVIGDLLAAQRVMTQRTFERVRRIELQLGVEPSHYEPGQPSGQPSDAADPPGGGAAVSGVTVSQEGIVTGNTYDKYGSTNPVVRRLMAGFEGALDELFALAAPCSLLDVGCGEGVLVHRWALQPQRRQGRRHRPARRSRSRPVGPQHQAPNLEYRVMHAENLPFAEDEFELASAIEVLEHVPDPEHTLDEMARCASRHLLVSVPREPLWRMLNMARGAYWSVLGNTPGHLNHWSRRSFVSLLSRHGEVVEVRSPFPWTMLLVRL